MNFRNFGKGLLSMMGATVFSLAISSSQAQTVGYFTDFNATTTAPSSSITANSLTALQINDITTFAFNSVKIVLIDETSNVGYSAGLSGRFADLQTYVTNGGILVVHDRSTGNTSNALLPGHYNTQLVRALDSDINVVTSGNLLINGPFGTITNTNLDGGNSSSHGYATLGLLPAGAVNYLTDGAGPAGNSVGFSYSLGSGFVYFSGIPLDFYRGGGSAFDTIYGNNVIALANSFVSTSTVPEPGSIALLVATGSASLFAFKRTRRRLKK